LSNRNIDNIFTGLAGPERDTKNILSGNRAGTGAKLLTFWVSNWRSLLVVLDRNLYVTVTFENTRFLNKWGTGMMVILDFIAVIIATICREKMGNLCRGKIFTRNFLCDRTLSETKWNMPFWCYVTVLSKSEIGSFDFRTVWTQSSREKFWLG